MGAKLFDKSGLLFECVEHGCWSNEYTREVFERGNSVAGIVYDTVKEKYIFVKQWRPGAEGDMIEIVAGSLDVEGEKPAEALKREIVEEMGYKVDLINHLIEPIVILSI